MFADDTSLFSKVLDLGKCVTKLSTDTYKRQVNGLTNGKFSLILIQRNKQMKLFSAIK